MRRAGFARARSPGYTTVRPALVRNAGAAELAKLPGVTHSACDPPSVKSTRRAFLRSSRSGRPLDGSGGAAGKAASRSGGCLEATSRAMGRPSLPSCSRMGDDEPGGVVASMNASTRVPGASTSAPPRARNGSAGWLSRAMTRTSCPSIFRATTLRWHPLIKRNLRRSLVRVGISGVISPLTV